MTKKDKDYELKDEDYELQAMLKDSEDEVKGQNELLKCVHKGCEAL